MKKRTLDSILRAGVGACAIAAVGATFACIKQNEASRAGMYDVPLQGEVLYSIYRPATYESITLNTFAGSENSIRDAELLTESSLIIGVGVDYAGKEYGHIQVNVADDLYVVDDAKRKESLLKIFEKDKHPFIRLDGAYVVLDETVRGEGIAIVQRGSRVDAYVSDVKFN